MRSPDQTMSGIAQNNDTVPIIHVPKTTFDQWSNWLREMLTGQLTEKGVGKDRVERLLPKSKGPFSWLDSEVIAGILGNQQFIELQDQAFGALAVLMHKTREHLSKALLRAEGQIVPMPAPQEKR